MKIIELDIRNFKSFADYNTPPCGVIKEAKQINMIYGENSSGKSNILKFISLLLSPKMGTEISIVVEGQTPQKRETELPFWKGLIYGVPHIYYKNDVSKEIKFDLKMELSKGELAESAIQGLEALEAEYGTDSPDSIFALNGIIKNQGDPSISEIILKRVTLNDKEVFSDNGVEKFYFKSGVAPQALLNEALIFENLIGIINNSILFLDTDRFINKESENSKNTLLTPKNFKNWLHNFSLKGFSHKRYDDFIKFIRTQKKLGPVFEHFDPTFARYGDEIQIMLAQGDEKLPIDSFGTGIQQMLFLLAIIFESKSRILLIEELELNLSPKAQKKFFQVLRKLIQLKEIDQVFFTTHSPYFKFTTDFAFFEVSMNPQGVSSILKQAAVRQSFFINNPMA